MDIDRCEQCVDLRSFVKNTIHVKFYLLTLAIPQWMLLSMLASQDHLIYTLLCFAGVLAILSAVQKWNSLKYKWFWSCTCIGACYQLTTLGLGTFLMGIKVQRLMMLVSAAFLICSFLLVLCFFGVNSGYTPNPYKLTGLAIFGLLKVIGLLTVGLVFSWRKWIDVAISLLLLSVLTILIAMVLISFDNYRILLPADALVVGFGLYMNFALIMLACFICYQRIHNSSIDEFKGSPT